MKRILLLLTFFIGFTLSSLAETKPIKESELPSAAQQFIKKHFADKKISYAAQDTDLFHGNYKIIFADGVKVDFDRKGNWTNVKCKTHDTVIPKTIIPEVIKKYVSDNYQNEDILEFGCNKDGGYKARLTSGIELNFNKEGTIIHVNLK